jgi:diaminohydroxyphosphoribosylaminopyrimidine deaminase/5-amino-6-(5-phosphoribosylamino)uracil reductase
MSAADRRLMQRALRLARRGWGQVQPNPLVGAIVVRDGEIVGEGWHAACGGPHAEVVALAAAGPAARGATLYVTLEPCSHTGRTPPCTDAILAAGVSRVVIAAGDPNPVAGGGAANLRAAGTEVMEGVGAIEARRLNAAFFHWHEQGRPWLALKLALSLDGAIGGRQGPRQLVTGEAARAEANRLRAGFDAILIGANTAARDDPLLTVRSQAVRVPPVRVVLDSAAGLRPEARLVRTARETPTLVIAALDAPPERSRLLEQAGAEVIRVGRGTAGLDLDAVLAALAARGVRSVLAEGGARLAQSLLGADLVERLYYYLAPRFLGPDALKAFDPWQSARVSRWQLSGHVRRGADLEIVLERDRS